ncbi:MAG: hypothetical protein PHU14_02365 [Methylovulum sp.]|nr:hypothetical protein [Methylovulum sp.]
MLDYHSVASHLREKFLESPNDYLSLYSKALNEGQNLLAVQVLKTAAHVYPGNPILKNQLERLSEVNPMLAKHLDTLPPRKIFGIGLSKTGTTSLAESVKLIGYRTDHWVNHDRDNKIIDWDEILSYDALFDTPIAFLFELLHFAFPDAYFIYSHRDINLWADSANTHFHCAKNFSAFKQLCLNGNGKGDIVDSALWRIIHLTLYANCSSYYDAYKIHEERVASFFSTHPSAHLLNIDITGPTLSGPEKWEAIRGYLQLDDKQIPLLPFPKQNSKDGFGQREDPSLKMPLPAAWQEPFKPKQAVNLLSKATLI